ncbi:MAG: GTP 3',8-cyclase MoaA [Bdellovibrionales bacterium]|nr:GTP 3',8-cyclase MoaA [Bdellovibrionales bacterium]
MEKLRVTDSFSRQFRYLRLSVTDICNFRCTYCLPDGYQKSHEIREDEMTVREIRNLCEGFNLLGFEKIRLTGGEPTLRKDLIEIVSAVSDLSNLKILALSTNGHNLDKLARPLREAGVNALNVSLDSLDPLRFRAVTGSGRFDSVMKGIESALESGYDSIKVNAVMLRGITELDISAFIEWVRTRPISVRFIELMRTGRNLELFEKRHFSGSELQLILDQSGWKAVERRSLAGPAVEFCHPDYLGRIGLIAPYSKDFCNTCNRLRVSSRGGLRLCLFGESDYSLRPYLNQDGSANLVAEAVRSVIQKKPSSHFLEQGKYGNTWNLASIGG